MRNAGLITTTKTKQYKALRSQCFIMPFNRSSW